MTAVMAFSYTFAQENPHLKSYSEKIDSIVVSEKSKMNAELDDVDRNFKDKKITAEEKQKQRAEIASRYEEMINEKVDAQQSELENATKSMVRSAVLVKKDSLYLGKNQLELGLGGV
jgi:ribonucleotide reductase beta subunit family protein with ferritin-like domain